MTTALDTRTENDTHSILIGYVCWLFGCTGAHRMTYCSDISTGSVAVVQRCARQHVRHFAPGF